MKRSRFTETQIVSILKEADAGATASAMRRITSGHGSGYGPAPD